MVEQEAVNFKVRGSNPRGGALRQAQCKPYFHEQMNAWYVYMLLCNQKTFYIGITDDIHERIANHKKKLSFFTKKFSDLELIYSEKYHNKYEAAKREQQLKGWSSAKKQILIDSRIGINSCTNLVEFPRG